MSDNSVPKKRKKSGKKLNKISFDEEIVPKNVAQQFNKTQSQVNSESTSTDLPTKKRKHRGKKHLPREEELATTNNAGSHPPKKPKRKNKQTNPPTEGDLEQPEDEEELDAVNPKVKQGESIRAKKRKKHQQLLLEKKVKVDLVMQSKCLNYLSQWKHNRNDWKFEKLRQVWLQQNMFDCDRIPDKFWETIIEYFSNAKGQIRQTILDDALKIVDKSEQDIDENKEDAEKEDEDDISSGSSSAERAKSMIQCLQEYLPL